jgi:hypothetical protein
MARQEKEGFSASNRETGDEHLLGKFARAGEVELALQKKADIGRLDVEFLGNGLYVVAVAGKPRLEIVDPRREHGFGQGGGDDLLAGFEGLLENARQILLAFDIRLMYCGGKAALMLLKVRDLLVKQRTMLMPWDCIPATVRGNVARAIPRASWSIT